MNTEQRSRLLRRLIAIMTAARHQGIAIVAGISVMCTSAVGAQTLWEHSVFNVVHEYIPSGVAAAPDHTVIPSNFIVNSIYRKVVDNMLKRSAMFRRQMLRVAGAPQLTVRLEMTPQPGPTWARATTSFVRQRNGQLTANIAINPMDDDAELIAHELEHVIEQLDEIDLAAQAARSGTGVRSTGGNGSPFETTRAIRVGRQVAHEVQ